MYKGVIFLKFFQTTHFVIIMQMQPIIATSLLIQATCVLVMAT
jgi:hypothetical protein